LLINLFKNCIWICLRIPKMSVTCTKQVADGRALQTKKPQSCSYFGQRYRNINSASRRHYSRRDRLGWSCAATSAAPQSWRTTFCWQSTQHRSLLLSLDICWYLSAVDEPQQLFDTWYSMLRSPLLIYTRELASPSLSLRREVCAYHDLNAQGAFVILGVDNACVIDWPPFNLKGCDSLCHPQWKRWVGLAQTARCHGAGKLN